MSMSRVNEKKSVSMTQYSNRVKGTLLPHIYIDPGMQRTAIQMNSII